MPGAHIGTLAESSLHAAVKQWLREPGDLVEAEVDGWLIDLVRGQTLIEVQTRGFSGIKRKLEQLLGHHTVRLVYPIAVEKRITRTDGETGEVISSRRSPKHGRVVDVFNELVAFPHLVAHPGLELQVLLVRQEEIWCDDGRGSWRRKGVSIRDRRLTEIVESISLDCPGRFLQFVPDTLEQPFTAVELAEALGVTQRLGQRAAYCLCKMGATQAAGKRGRALLYSISRD